LPAYFATADDGIGLDASRGCVNSYLTTFAPELWLDLAENWFQRYVKHFWQEKVYGVGFREFGQGQISSTGNLDSEPIIDEFGVAATAFGLSACRANERYYMGYPLSAQMMVATWPIPFGGLLLPRILSKPHPPLVGEVSVAYQLSQGPKEG
jgi:hypothetical protein